MFVLLAALATAQQAEEPPMEFEQYAFVMLEKGPRWSVEDTPENRELMKGHLAHFGKMVEAGKMVVAGPFSEQEDDSLRGLPVPDPPGRGAEARRAGPAGEGGPPEGPGHDLVDREGGRRLSEGRWREALVHPRSVARAVGWMR